MPCVVLDRRVEKPSNFKRNNSRTQLVPSLFFFPPPLTGILKGSGNAFENVPVVQLASETKTGNSVPPQIVSRQRLQSYQQTNTREKAGGGEGTGRRRGWIRMESVKKMFINTFQGQPSGHDACSHSCTCQSLFNLVCDLSPETGIPNSLCSLVQSPQ